MIIICLAMNITKGVAHWKYLVHDRDKWRNIVMVVKTLTEYIVSSRRRRYILRTLPI